MARPVTVGLNLTANTLTTVYTVPNGYWAKWNLMYLFNGTGSTKHITAYWVDTSAGADIYVQNQNNVTSKEYVRIDGGAYVVMEEGDMIKMQSEAGSSFSTICTFELFKKDGV
jgi:hypothetical protein